MISVKRVNWVFAGLMLGLWLLIAPVGIVFFSYKLHTNQDKTKIPAFAEAVTLFVMLFLAALVLFIYELTSDVILSGLGVG